MDAKNSTQATINQLSARLIINQRKLKNAEDAFKRHDKTFPKAIQNPLMAIKRKKLQNDADYLKRQVSSLEQRINLLKSFIE